jgi:DNA-binding MarR family transcriptional regulator
VTVELADLRAAIRQLERTAARLADLVGTPVLDATDERLLTVLDRQGPLTAAMLASFVGVHRATASRRLAGLIANGLVEARPGWPDRSRVVFVPTATAVALIAPIGPPSGPPSASRPPVRPSAAETRARRPGELAAARESLAVARARLVTIRGEAVSDPAARRRVGAASSTVRHAERRLRLAIEAQELNP